MGGWEVIGVPCPDRDSRDESSPEPDWRVLARAQPQRGWLTHLVRHERASATTRPDHSAVDHLRGQPRTSVGYDTAAQLGREAHVIGGPELEKPSLGRRIDVESLDPSV